MTALPNRLRRMMPQQVTADDLDEWAKEIELLEDDPCRHFCHRFAILMECMILGDYRDKYWTEATTLFSEYQEANAKWSEAMGEPYVSGFGKD